MVLSDKYFQLGYDAMRRKDFEEAEINFQKAMSYKHDHTKTLLQYGLLLQSRKDFAGAVELWRIGADAMLKNKHHVQMLCNLSVVLTKVVGDHEGAERYFKAGLECDKDHVGCLVISLPSHPSHQAGFVPPFLISSQHPFLSLSPSSTPSPLRPRLNDLQPPCSAAPFIAVMPRQTLIVPDHLRVPNLLTFLPLPNVQVNYGLFLCSVRKDHEKAESMLKRAIKADPTRTKINNGGYLLQELISRHFESRPSTVSDHRQGTGNMRANRRKSIF